MTEQAKQFIEKVSNDEALKAELDAALEGIEEAEQITAMLRFAEKKSFVLTQEDFADTENDTDKDINLDELEIVTGAGQKCFCNYSGSGSGQGMNCSCTRTGYGYYAGRMKACACFNHGVGEACMHFGEH